MGTTHGTNQMVKPWIWRWSGQLAVWYLPASRGSALRIAGIHIRRETARHRHEVILAIDGGHGTPKSWRPTAPPAAGQGLTPSPTEPTGTRPPHMPRTNASGSWRSDPLRKTFPRRASVRSADAAA